MDKKTFGQNLKAARKRKNLTLEQFAERAELSPKTVWRIENGQRGTTITTLVRICQILDTSPSILLAADLDDSYPRKSEYELFFQYHEQLSETDKQLISKIIAKTIDQRSYYRDLQIWR